MSAPSALHSCLLTGIVHGDTGVSSYLREKALLDYSHLTCLPGFRENEKNMKFKLKDLKS